MITELKRKGGITRGLSAVKRHSGETIFPEWCSSKKVENNVASYSFWPITNPSSPVTQIAGLYLSDSAQLVIVAWSGGDGKLDTACFVESMADNYWCIPTHVLPEAWFGDTISPQLEYILVSHESANPLNEVKLWAVHTGIPNVFIGALDLTDPS